MIDLDLLNPEIAHQYSLFLCNQGGFKDNQSLPLRPNGKRPVNEQNVTAMITESVDLSIDQIEAVLVRNGLKHLVVPSN